MPHSEMPRSEDDRHLLWLSMRHDGHSGGSIAARDGHAGRGQVIRVTNAIRKADIEHCGNAVDWAYW
mgnify:CR=1 FL=1